ncbi:GIY-YIG nuclease family protein [Bacillus sp. OTU530]|uniref:GIY-YIG nuclease family protein n=1 Tax=Bacillus sp. OTU530 TaxID=3043862 RepID=UPI00313D4A9A
MDRKFEKSLYKQTHTQMGVYQIKNVENEKIFIGSSMDLAKIMNRHKFELKIKSHFNKRLQQDWDTFGEHSFSFEILETIKPEEETIIDVNSLHKYKRRLAQLEEKWLQELLPYEERGYNYKK